MNTRTVNENDNNSNFLQLKLFQMKFLKGLDVTAIIAIFSVFTWYYVSISSEMLYKTLGLPEQYIEFPFYNLVKSAEPLFMIALPSVILFLLLIAAVGNRALIKKYGFRDETKKSVERSELRNKRNLYCFTAVALWSLYGISLASRFGISQFQTMIFISSVVITINASWYTFYYWRNSSNPYSTRLERAFNEISFVYASLVIYGFLILLSLYIYTTNQPYTLTIYEESIKCENNFCDFEYLVSDRNGYSVWSTLSYKIPKTTDTKENEIYLLNEEKNLMNRNMIGKTMFEIEVERKWRIREKKGKGGEEVKTMLYIDGFEELKNQMNYEFREELFEEETN